MDLRCRAAIRLHWPHQDPRQLDWVAGLDVPVDQQLACYEACGKPKKLVKLPGAQHYESYYFVRPDLHEIGMKEAVEWFKTFL